MKAAWAVPVVAAPDPVLVSAGAVADTAGTDGSAYAAGVSVKGPAARELLRYVIDQLQPWIPDDVTLRVRKRSLTATRAGDGEDFLGSLYASWMGSVGGTWSPWLPRRVAVRVTAHDAVDRVLHAIVGSDSRCTVSPRIDGDAVEVTIDRVTELGIIDGTIRIPISLCT